MFSSVSGLSVLAGAMALFSAAQAAVPSLKSVFPAGGQRGTTVEVTLEGGLEKGMVWVEGGGVTFTPPTDKGLTKAMIALEAEPGLRLLRVFNAEGVSEPVRFMVGTLSEVIEVKPNQAPIQAPLFEPLPVWINGRIDRAGELDHFAFQLKKGQTIRIEMYAYTLGSPIDPLLHVLDEKGTRLATASDGRNLDPMVTFTAPADGRYTVQLAGFVHPPASEVSFTGGGTVVYRLLLHPGPLATGVYPAVVAPPTFTRRGLGLAKHLPLGERLQKVWVPDGVLPVEVLAAAASPQVEVEPNDVADKATVLAAVPAVVGGVMEKGADRDRFAFPVKKGQKLRAEIFAQRLGLPLDATLKVFDEAGKSLGVSEDQKDVADPAFSWTVAADGIHQVEVADQFHRGGEGNDYVLEVAEVTPSFEATLAEGKPLKVVRGKKLELKVNVKLLDGWKEPLLVRVLGLPAPLSVKEVSVPEKGGDVTVAIEPAGDVVPGTHPFALVITTRDGAQSKVATFDLRGENRRGTSQSDRDETLWLTVTEK